jgi:transcriptional regulator with XRE-family HTH domain
MLGMMGTPPVEVTTESFQAAFTRLKAESGKSFRQLAAALADSGKRLSPTYLSDLATGRERPAPGAMARIAVVLGKDPTYFAEYRLAQLRALLDEGGYSGLDGALSAASAIPVELQVHALELDPTEFPHVTPSGANAAWRSRAASAA